MIVVIADDFTGAAEIAGIGIQYGLNVTLELEAETEPDVDLLIIATNTRSMSKEDAYEKMTVLRKKLLEMDYDWLFKKTDSVFRGHVLLEIKALLNEKNKALLVASNPVLGRKIINGLYYINNKLLNETEFANDPEYPIKTASVLKLIGNDEDISIKLLSPKEEISGEGIYLGEAGTLGDLKKLALKIKGGIIPAGASGFFSALLETKGYRKKKLPSYKLQVSEKKHLIVVGSSYAKTNSEMTGLENGEDIFVSVMPKDVFYGGQSTQSSMNKWVLDIINAFKKYKKVIVKIDKPILKNKTVSERLKEQLAYLVARVFTEIKIEEIIIVGGATAYSIVRKLGFTKFYPVYEWAPGVIRMRVKNHRGLFLTIKPGSYKWPVTL